MCSSLEDMADNYEISNTLESLQKAVEIIDSNVHAMKVKLQAPHLYLDPFKIEISNNALNKVHKEVVTFRDSVLDLLKQVKEETKDWQQLNENIKKSNLAIRNELKQVEINFERYGYTPLDDINILEVPNICGSGLEQHLSPVTSIVRKTENVCLNDENLCDVTLVTPMLCRKSKSERSIEKDIKPNLLEAINLNQSSLVVSQYEEGGSVRGNVGVEVCVPKVEKNCDLGADLKQNEMEEDIIETRTDKETESSEASTAGCGKYSVYYYELMKAKKDKLQSNIADDGTNKNKSSENATSESGKYSVYYYELMKKSGKNQAQ